MNYTEFKTYNHDFNKPSYINVRYFNAAGKFLFEELLFANISGVRYLMELDAFADNPCGIAYAELTHREENDNPYLQDWYFFAKVTL